MGRTYSFVHVFAGGRRREELARLELSDSHLLDLAVRGISVEMEVERLRREWVNVVLRSRGLADGDEVRAERVDGTVRRLHTGIALPARSGRVM